MSSPENEQQRQNTENIAQNTEDIAQNSQDIRQNLATLNAGGEDRWRHIHRSEQKIQDNTDDITVLNLIKLRRVQYRLNVLAGFVLAGLLVIAGFLQVQATEARDLSRQQCHEAQVRAVILNQDLDRISPAATTTGLSHVEVPQCP